MSQTNLAEIITFPVQERPAFQPVIVPKQPVLTVLSYGGGQDSWALLLKAIHDEQFKRKYIPGRFLVVMSDTNDEHPYTKSHIQRTKKLCEKHNIEFVFVTNDMGFHSKSWPGLREFYNRTQTVGSKCFPKTCTAQLKLDVIYRYLEHWLGLNYGVIVDRKNGFKEFAKRYGQIHVMVGIAKGEEARLQDPTKEKDGWKKQCIKTIYPLVDLGLDRAGAQAYSRSVGEEPPFPSNCILCPFMSLQELLWLARVMPEDYADWVRIEAAKIEKNRHMDAVEVTKNGKTKTENKNYGVWGTKLLPEMLKEAEAAFGSWTIEELTQYKFSHGHCVMSKY